MADIEWLISVIRRAPLIHVSDDEAAADPARAKYAEAVHLWTAEAALAVAEAERGQTTEAHCPDMSDAFERIATSAVLLRLNAAE